MLCPEMFVFTLSIIGSATIWIGSPREYLQQYFARSSGLLITGTSPDLENLYFCMEQIRNGSSATGLRDTLNREFTKPRRRRRGQRRLKNEFIFYLRISRYS